MTENRTPESVPYIVHESALARAERHNRRLWIALLVSIVLIVVSNVIWLVEWMSYDYVSTETVTVDGKDGIASYIGNDGDISYGENYSKTNPDADKTGSQGNS